MGDPFNPAWMEDDDDLGMDGENLCDHLLDYGRQRKFDGGRCPILCGKCRLILGFWEVAEGGTLHDGPYKYTEFLCDHPEHGYRCGEPIEYIQQREPDPQEGQGLW